MSTPPQPPPKYQTINLTLQKVDEKCFFALAGLNNQPVNAMSRQMWKDLNEMLDYLEEHCKLIQGLIIYSEAKKDLFTAGNDLMELYAPKTSENRFTEFWLLQTTFLGRLYRTPLVTIASIRGYCPAGGCGLSLCCDYRIMTNSQSVPSSKIGLNEVLIGIMVPKYWAQLFLRTAGSWGKAEKSLTFAQMLSPEEALTLGIVDELSSKDSLLEKSIERMREMLRLPRVGRALTKTTIRNSFGLEWENYGREEAKLAWKELDSHDIKKSLGNAMKMLSKSKI